MHLTPTCSGFHKLKQNGGGNHTAESASTFSPQCPDHVIMRAVSVALLCELHWVLPRWTFLIQVGTAAYHRPNQIRVVLLDGHMNRRKGRPADSLLRQGQLLEAMRLQKIINGRLGCSDLFLLLRKFLARLLLLAQGLDTLSLGLLLLGLPAGHLCLSARLLILAQGLDTLSLGL